MKIELTLGDGIEDLINHFANVAGITPELLISNILNFRDQEMSELLDFSSAFPDGSEKHAEVFTLLRNFSGGTYIYEEMKEIDSEYLTPQEFFASFDDEFLDGLVGQLMLTDPTELPS
jgi:hypothetical protein